MKDSLLKRLRAPHAVPYDGTRTGRETADSFGRLLNDAATTIEHSMSLIVEARLRAEDDLFAVGHSRDGDDRTRAMADLRNWIERLKVAEDACPGRTVEPHSFDDYGNCRFCTARTSGGNPTHAQTGETL